MIKTEKECIKFLQEELGCPAISARTMLEYRMFDGRKNIKDLLSENVLDLTPYLIQLVEEQKKMIEIHKDKPKAKGKPTDDWMCEFVPHIEVVEVETTINK